MPRLSQRPWVPEVSADLVQRIAASTDDATHDALADRIDDLLVSNRANHERDCFNMNPETNEMNPAAEATLSAGKGTRPSLGYPGEKYETGLEAIEEVEVIAAELAARVFDADFAEIRVPSGSIANLYAFMVTTSPGDAIIVPPPEIGGHVTHREDGCAGLYGLEVHTAPIAADGYTVDVGALAELAADVRPRLITIGGSLNLFPHPTGEIKAIADSVGARVLVDAAHQCGMVAGGVWPNPLADGADIMTMSTYKSLGGPPSGLIVTNDAAIAERLDAIAYPGMTANFDAAKSAALAITMLDWLEYGAACASAMVDVAKALADALTDHGIPVFAADRGATSSHQFAVIASAFGGGQLASKKLRAAGFLACGIGLPLPEVPGDLNGLRLGTPELVRWGIGVSHAPRMAALIADALRRPDPAALAGEVAEWRRTFDQLHYIR